MNERISKGKKGTTCSTDLRMEVNNNEINLSKGCLGLILNKKQGKDLRDWLNEIFGKRKFKLK